MKMEDIRRAASRHHIPKYRCISFYSILFSAEGVLYYVYERKTKGFLTWKIYHCH